MRLRGSIKLVYDWITHTIGRISKRYYFEDFVRVYPNRVVYSRLGQSRSANDIEFRNYLNHRKFYDFAAQFVSMKEVVDVGCGSGYGCAILAEHGAKRVCGCDVSKHALSFAREHYGTMADFSEQTITNLHEYPDNSFDITISSEVLEHIKEYHLEDLAVYQLKRITRPGGLVVVGTPNSEMLGDHGFSYDEIRSLFSKYFRDVCIFENAFVPTPANKRQWTERQSSGRTGVVISQCINLNESVVQPRQIVELKRGLDPGHYAFSDVSVDTSLLHNTHSWIVVARKMG